MADQSSAGAGEVPRRPLGRTGARVSALGVGGHHLGTAKTAEEAIHLRTIQMGYPFDAVQMPLNPFDANFFSFEKEVLPEANRRGIGVLGMKPMGGTAAAIKVGVVTAEEMLRYAMSLPVATTISGM